MQIEVPGSVLSARDMHVEYPVRDGVVHALRGVSLDVRRGEVVAIVGESGCGKSTLALAVQDLIRPPGRVRGRVELESGVSLYDLAPRQRRRLHGEKVGMVFQASQSSMNPVLTIGAQAGHVAQSHGLPAARGVGRLGELLARVGLDPGRVLASYPHELSGGQRQRVSLCLALVLDPPLVILDEPTTALDVLTQEEVLETLLALRRDLGTAFVLVTHDMGIVASTADRVLVLYAGEVAEQGTVDAVLRHPRHPYTRALVASMPRLDRSFLGLPIAGAPPDLTHVPAGCVFASRCPLQEAICLASAPALVPVATDGQHVACHVAQRAEAAQ